MPIHVVAFGSGCMVGGFVVALLCRRAVREVLVETAVLARANAELRAQVLGHIFRPVSPEEADAVMADWITQYDPNWSAHDG